MAPPSTGPYPAEHPAALPVSVSVSLPLHPDHPLWSGPKSKNPRGTRPRGFRSGWISPVDFSLMPQTKEQIKNFFRKLQGKQDVAHAHWMVSRARKADMSPAVTFRGSKNERRHSRPACQIRL